MPNHDACFRSTGALHVAELARFTQVTPATIRYYSRIGLLRPRRNPDNGYRCFSAADIQRVTFIRRVQSLGLTIGDIRSLLESVDRGGEIRSLIRGFAEARLGSVREQIAELRVIEARIVRALGSWEVAGEDSLVASGRCSVIEHTVPDAVLARRVTTARPGAGTRRHVTRRTASADSERAGLT